MWKFIPRQAYEERDADVWWNFRKLVLCGVCVSSLVISMSVSRLKPFYALVLGVALFGLFMFILLVFWYVYVIPEMKRDDLDEDSRSKETTTGAETMASNAQTPTQTPTSSFAASYKQSKQKEESDKEAPTRLPVTIITGFLGSGKTTCVKNILSNTMGMKVLVIENEIGTEGIDHDLLLPHTQKEEIILMNNGCICCTVRKDLLLTFHRLFENEAFDRIDWIVIETTGLADPAPLIQTLYIDEKCNSKLRLDSVLTMVDCKHLPLHLERDQKGEKGAHGGAVEARLQLAFADRIIINKTDLVSPTQLEALTNTISLINPTATLLPCQHAIIPLHELLNLRAFDASRNERLLKTEKASLGTGPILIQRDSNGKIVKKTTRFGERPAGDDLLVQGGLGGVSTVSLSCDEPLNLDRFNDWASALLKSKGEDLYRLKGILCMQGYDCMFMVQGVHMIFDGQRGGLWKPEESRRSRLVLIGVKLDAQELKKGFHACCEL